MRDQQPDSSTPKVRSRQAQRARSFWDAAYNNDDERQHAGGSSSTHTEWIVSPGDVLRFLPTHGQPQTLQVLEIGCGDSLLGEAIYDHLTRLANDRERGAEGTSADEPEQHVSVVCTDISPVAIDRLVARQKQEDSERRRRPGLHYLVADATELPATFGFTSDGDDHDKQDEERNGESCMAQSLAAALGAGASSPESPRHLLFDVVVDKGCADTFQFRGKTNESDELLRQLFHSVYAVLRPGGAYLVVTPRRKVKHLRSWGWDSDSSGRDGSGTGSPGIDRQANVEGDNSGCCARLGWASSLRHDLGIPDSGELARKKSGGHRVYLHECLKPTVEQTLAVATAARVEAVEGGVGISDGCRDSDDGLAPRCGRCGLERAKSRYQNTKSWSGHLEWCQVPYRSEDEEATR